MMASNYDDDKEAVRNYVANNNPKRTGAIILSILIAGAGQIYLGYVKRGIVILIAGFLIGVTAGYFLGYWGVLVSVAYWIWQIFDVNRLSKQPLDN